MTTPQLVGVPTGVDCGEASYVTGSTYDANGGLTQKAGLA